MLSATEGLQRRSCSCDVLHSGDTSRPLSSGCARGPFCTRAHRALFGSFSLLPSLGSPFDGSLVREGPNPSTLGCYLWFVPRSTLTQLPSPIYLYMFQRPPVGLRVKSISQMILATFQEFRSIQRLSVKVSALL